MAFHTCSTSDGFKIPCMCLRGADHDEAEFDIPVGQELGEDEEG